jgi:hypothetical protein
MLFWGGLIAVAGFYLFSTKTDMEFNLDTDREERVEVGEPTDWTTLVGFDAIDLEGGYRVVYHYAAESRVEAEGPREAQARLEGEVRGETLYLAHREGFQKIDDDLTIHVYAPGLRQVEVSGAVKLTGTEPMKAESLELDLSGAGKIDLALEVERLEASISGAGKYLLRGEATEAEFKIAGAGDVRAFDLITERLSLRVAGAGNAEVHATQALDVKLMGAGKVIYDGQPAEVNPQIMGAGSLQPRAQ